MNNNAAAFVAILSDILDQLQFGKRTPYGRDQRLGLHSREYFSVVNKAIWGARYMEVIPMSVAKFSPEEIVELGKKLRALGAMRATDEIRRTFCEALRGRGVPKDLVETACLLVDKPTDAPR